MIRCEVHTWFLPVTPVGYIYHYMPSCCSHFCCAQKMANHMTHNTTGEDGEPYVPKVLQRHHDSVISVQRCFLVPPFPAATTPSSTRFCVYFCHVLNFSRDIKCYILLGIPNAFSVSFFQKFKIFFFPGTQGEFPSFSLSKSEFPPCDEVCLSFSISKSAGSNTCGVHPV